MRNIGFLIIKELLHIQKNKTDITASTLVKNNVYTYLIYVLFYVAYTHTHVQSYRFYPKMGYCEHVETYFT